MGRIYRQKVTRAVPEGAEIFTRKGKRFAKWQRNGRTVTAPVNEHGRVVLEARTFTARYRDGAGIVREVATGCRDAAAARSILHELESRSEKVRAGVLTPAEAAAANRQDDLLAQHLDAYCEHMRQRGFADKHRSERTRMLGCVMDECGFRRVRDLDAKRLEQWLAQKADSGNGDNLIEGHASGMGARTRNLYLQSAQTFAAWAVRNGILTANPFKNIAKAHEASDRRRTRRALAPTEAAALLDAAERRPLANAMKCGKVDPERRAALIAKGRERARIYRTLIYTGLRISELASITVAQCDLEGAAPCLHLDARNEKSRRGARIGLRRDLAAELARHLADSLNAARGAAQAAGMPIPARLPGDSKLFSIPQRFVRELDKDAAFAGIAKEDARGRVLDVHSLRVTFCSFLSAAGVSPRVAMEAMRHRDIRLTLNTYTDPALLDVSGAIETLPSLAAEPAHSENRQNG